MSLKTVARYWLPAICMLLLICLESTTFFSGNNTGHFLQKILIRFHLKATVQQVESLNFYLRKCGHFCGYGLLSLFTFRALLGSFLSRRYDFPWWKNVSFAEDLSHAGWRLHWHLSWALAGVAAAACMGMADELHQLTLPGRSGSIHDALLDTMGGVTAQLLVFLYHRYCFAQKLR